MPKDAQPFWIVGRGDTLSGIIKSRLGITENGAISRKVTELVLLNKHIEHADKIYPGQVIYLGSPSGIQATPVHVEDLREMSRLFSDSGPDTLFTQNYWESVSVLSDEVEATDRSPVLDGMSCSPGTLATQLGCQPASAASRFSYATAGYKALKGANKTAQEVFKGTMGNFVKPSPFAWQVLEGEYTRSFGKRVSYLKSGDVATLIPKNARAFQLGGRAILVQPDSSSFRAFSSKVAKAKKVSKNLLGPAGKVMKVIDLGISAKNIYNDWDTPQRGKTISRESAKTAAGIGFGLVAAEVGTGVCTVLTFTTGPGGVACFFVVTVGGAWLASEGAARASDFLYEKLIPLGN